MTVDRLTVQGKEKYRNEYAKVKLQSIKQIFPGRTRFQKAYNNKERCHHFMCLKFFGICDTEGENGAISILFQQLSANNCQEFADIKDRGILSKL